MKQEFQHPALRYYNPETGEYDESQNENENGIIICDGKYEVCPECNGHGTHFRRDLDENAMVESMREDGDDEGIDRYYSGAFDEVCNECYGKRVVFSPTLPEWAEKLLFSWYECKRKHREISAAERRLGA